MSSGKLEPVPDIVVWVDTTLRGNDTAISQPTNNRVAAVPFNTMGSFVEGPAGAIDIPEMERRNMSLAEREQCALDDFWGMVANQVEQAEATAAMEREDQRSQDIRARIKKEERYTLWEQEDLRKRETRRVVKENLEDAARREYLEVSHLLQSESLPPLTVLARDVGCETLQGTPDLIMSLAVCPGFSRMYVQQYGFSFFFFRDLFLFFGLVYSSWLQQYSQQCSTAPASAARAAINRDSDCMENSCGVRRK